MPTNRQAKFDTTSIILGGEIRNRRNTHKKTGKVCIYSLLFVLFYECVCVCTVTNFSGKDKARGVKFCMAVCLHVCIIDVANTVGCWTHNDIITNTITPYLTVTRWRSTVSSSTCEELTTWRLSADQSIHSTLPWCPFSTRRGFIVNVDKLSNRCATMATVHNHYRISIFKHTYLLKSKASHTRYWALSQQLIPVYRQSESSTRR